MNCDRTQELLVDLVYGELAGPDRQAVEQHLSACASCRREFEQLKTARLILAQHRAGESSLGPVIPTAGRVATWPRRLFTIVTAAAAVLIVGAGLWLVLQAPTPQARAALGPVEITRTGVSLTILSKPDNWPGQFRWSDDQQPSQVLTQVRYSPAQSFQVGGQMDAQITVFANAPVQSLIRPYTWPGMALVRDQRLVRNLRKGVTDVRLTGVPSGILPDTVRLRGIDHPRGMSILEQNYQYDLASAGAVLKRYIDKPITVLFKDGNSASGKLLSFDGRTLVIQPPGKGPRNVERAEVKAISFEKLPEGLLTRPTLLWKLENRAAARQKFEVAYLTYGVNWRADYVLKLHVAEGKVAREGPRELPVIFDTADIVGYATVMNHSGVTYEDAQLKLMAGDVNLIKPNWVRQRGWGWAQNDPLSVSNAAVPQFQEKSFFEYHLYTLGRPTTIRSNETKQIELLSGSGLKLKRGYVYDPLRGHKTAVRVVSELMNSKENNLGKPLPKGVVRLYAPDPEGVQTYVSQTTIDHTPKDEKIRLRWGFAFDIVGAFKQTHYRKSGNGRQVTWRQYQLRNHKDYDVKITIVAHVPKSTYKANCKIAKKDYPWHVRQVGLVEIDVPVKSNESVTVTFRHSYNNLSGGGLTSPYDRKGTTH